MSVRVNLLPAATKARGRASQQRTALIAAGVVLLAGLAGVYWWAVSEVNATEQELLAEQAVTAELQSEEVELVGFSDLADRADAATQALQIAMVPEVSLAGVLQDVASVMPADTQLETLVVDLPVPVQPAAEATTPPAPVGTFSITGRTLTAHAPGVERFLLQLDKMASFRGVYLNSSTLDELDEPTTTFSVDGQIGVEATTGRYDEGLPEELR